jgi:hypothetical protein
MSMLYRGGELLGSVLRRQDLARPGYLAAQHRSEHRARDAAFKAAARLPAAHPLGAAAGPVGVLPRAGGDRRVSPIGLYVARCRQASECQDSVQNPE